MIQSTKLPASLQEIVDACESSDTITPAQAERILTSAAPTAEDLAGWARYDHPVVDGYGRQAVALGDNYELMIMSWIPGDFSAIHDHGHTQWGAVMYFGHAEHAIYDLDDMQLRTRERVMTSPGQINQVDHDLIHQMGNSTDVPFLSLHLYGCADQVDGVTGDARIFDLLNQEIQYTDGGVFYCLPEETINRRGDAVVADRETTLEHHKQMLDRIGRINSTPGRYDRDLDGVASQLVEALRELESKTAFAA